MIDWRQRNVTFFNALQVELNVMFLILMLIVFVAAVNIVSGLIMLVKDKGSALPSCAPWAATEGAIMRVFLIDLRPAIGFVGTLFGFLLGTVVCLLTSSSSGASWVVAHRNTSLSRAKTGFSVKSCRPT